jgi:hypothetical protein
MTYRIMTYRIARGYAVVAAATIVGFSELGVVGKIDVNVRLFR